MEVPNHLLAEKKDALVSRPCHSLPCFCFRECIGSSFHGVLDFPMSQVLSLCFNATATGDSQPA